MQRRTRWWTIVAAVLVLAGCGAGDRDAPEPATEAPDAAPAEAGSPLMMGDPAAVLAAQQQAELEPIPDLPTPPAPGIWWWHDGEFNALTRVAIVKRADGLARAYCVAEDAAPPAELPAGELQFIDHGRIERKLLRLDAEGCAGVPGPPPDHAIQLDGELGEEVLPGLEGLMLRKVTLAPGAYVYADWTTRWFREEASSFVVK